MQIGFVGLGAMAGRLLGAGHELQVWNRTAQRAEALRARGAKVAATPAEAASRSQAVVTMVADANEDGPGETFQFTLPLARG